MLDANEFLHEVMYVISGFDVNIVIKKIMQPRENHHFLITCRKMLKLSLITANTQKQPEGVKHLFDCDKIVN